MSERLKPCPFCGGQAYACEYVSTLRDYRIEDKVAMNGMVTRDVKEVVLGAGIVGLAGCVSCKAQVDAFADKYSEPGTAKSAAIEAWNTRAERTCRDCKWLGRESIVPGEYRCNRTERVTTLDDYCSKAVRRDAD